MTKIHLILFLVNCLLTNVRHQKLEQKISLFFEETPLQEILDHINYTYAIEFSYGNDRIPLHRKITIHVTRQPLSVAMEMLFNDLGIQYKQIENHIVLRKKDPIKQPQSNVSVSEA